jgi:hypothetical protein
MTSTSRIHIRQEFAPLSTRESGERARAAVEDVLHREPAVILDFAGAQPTPSFADELLGHLILRLGSDRFRAQVKLENVEDDVRPLLQTILYRRARANVVS